MGQGTLSVGKDLTTGDVAKVLIVCRDTARRLIRSGAIAGYSIGMADYYRVPAESLRDYMRLKGYPEKRLDDFLSSR